LSEKTDLGGPLAGARPDATESVILGELCDNPPNKGMYINKVGRDGVCGKLNDILRFG